MAKTAVIAGQGALAPAVIKALRAAGEDPLVAAPEGYAPDGVAALPFRLERLVPFLDHLRDEGVTRVSFAGAVRRPALNPELFDPQTATLVPRIVTAMRSGDDAALRTVLEIFEEWGLAIAATPDIVPDLVPGPGLLCGAPSEADRADAARGRAIVEGLGGLDLGQGAVVAQGLCLAVETLPGTQAMLEFAARHQHLRPDPGGAKGVFYKAPKPEQDRRIDLPALGPDTVAQAARAGLAGIAWEAGGVILLDRARMIADAQSAGIFLWARG